MRLVIVLSLAVLLLAGCASESSETQSPAIDPETEASVEASPGADLTQNVETLARVDSVGRTPNESVLALVDAANAGQWDTLYSLYAFPTPDFDNATREWVEARETYEDFRVLEVRVVSADAAFVRVAYKVTLAPMGSSEYSVWIEDPGEWWPMHKVDGEWKTQWMPRQ